MIVRAVCAATLSLALMGGLSPAIAAPVTATDLDLATEPPGVLSAKTQQKLWDAYKTAKQCFRHPDYDPGVSLVIPAMDAKEFGQPWVSPFTQVFGAKECKVAPGSLTPPKPVPVVKLDETYGERQDNIDNAAIWFRQLTTYSRYSNDPLAASLVKQALVDWASGKSLGKGIHVSWGSKPVDYQMMATILALLTATAQVAPSFTDAERAVVGPWLNNLVKQSAASRWKDRADNKAFMRTYMAMLWGLTIGDKRPVQNAIFAYKLAVHDMRPDGSWPVDSQRSGMGLLYNAASTGYIVMIAVALQQALGVDLFSYSVDGRSVHNAVDFVVKSILEPKKTNSLYAIPCEEGGDRFGGIDTPNMHFAENEVGYLLAYAERFPDKETSKAIFTLLGAREAMDSEKTGGAAACQFALTGGTVDLAALVLPPPPPTLPKPQFVVDTREAFVDEVGHTPKVYSLMQSTIIGGKKNENKLAFSIVGDFNFMDENFSTLRIVIDGPVGATKPKALEECGVQTEFYDDKQHHAVIDFVKTGTEFKAARAECLIKALPPKLAFQAKFLLANFRDVAIGMVESGSVDGVKNDALKIFLRRAALGEVKLGM